MPLHYASHALLRTEGGTFFFERKPEGYRVPAFAGNISLPGGSRLEPGELLEPAQELYGGGELCFPPAYPLQRNHPQDRSPLDTLERELGEEISNPELARFLAAGARPWRQFLVHVPERLVGKACGGGDYQFVLTAFEIVLPQEFAERHPEYLLPGGIPTTDGLMTPLEQEGMERELFAWGMGSVTSRYLRERMGADVKLLDHSGIAVHALATDPGLTYEEREQLVETHG